MKMAQQLIMKQRMKTITTKIKIKKMNKSVLFALAVLISTLSFAQKKELKAADKAIKNSNYAEANAALNQAESMMSAMDDKQKAQYNLLRAKALFANGTGNDNDVDSAIEHLNKSNKNDSDVAEFQSVIENSLLTKANDLYQGKNYDSAARKFSQLYQTVPSDTTYLYYAAVSAVTGQDYETALDYYLELDKLGYKGQQTEYFATNKETGVEEVMDKQTRDLYLKSGEYIKAGERLTESKSGEITKNIALIYVQLDKKDEAIAAIKKARKNEPDNISLILTEADLYYKLGDIDSYKGLVEEAVALNPNDVDLLYNLGVISSQIGDNEAAKNYYSKVIELDPSYVNAQTNMAAMILEGEQALIEEMNSLGSSAADNKRYDELKEERMQLYNDAIPYLENVLKEEPNNLQASKTLMNIYSAIGNTNNYKAMKAKVEELSGN